MILLFLALASLLGLSSQESERPLRAQVEMGALDASGGSHSDAYNVKLASSLDVGYTQRDSEDVGAQNVIEKNTDLLWIAEAGYRYSKTRPVQRPSRYENYLRIYTKAEKVLKKRWVLEGALEYLPNLTRSRSDLGTVEASLTTILNSTFALKLSSEFQYQQSPYSGDKRFSGISSMNLVAQF